MLGVREATSGIAYAFEFNETNQSLAKKAEFLEQAEKEIHRLVAKWMGDEYDGNISYPREFGVDDFVGELGLLAEARSTFSSETTIKELEKKIASKLFAKESQKLREKISGEIERGDTRNPSGIGRDWLGDTFDQMTATGTADTGKQPPEGNKPDQGNGNQTTSAPQSDSTKGSKK